ncbi:MAG: transposase [Thermodesulfobacteriota bacterium]|nr:transposase [Thermodesulfobacteriota bacterium]
MLGRYPRPFPPDLIRSICGYAEPYSWHYLHRWFVPQPAPQPAPQPVPRHPIWQRNYYEHIIRNETDLHRIREYIQTNPARWESDSLYSIP